jgi:hypothetical protein
MGVLKSKKKLEKKDFFVLITAKLNLFLKKVGEKKNYRAFGNFIYLCGCKTTIAECLQHPTILVLLIFV